MAAAARSRNPSGGGTGARGLIDSTIARRPAGPASMSTTTYHPQEHATMARTLKTEWSRPDGWHIGARLERQARPAGRFAALLAEALEELADLDESTTYRLALAS